TGLVGGLVTDRQIPSVLVAHELADAQAFADLLAVIDQGTLLQAGPPPAVVGAGPHPDRGIVLTGLVTAGRPAGAMWETDLLIGAAEVTCRLADRPTTGAGDLVLTALDPPW